MCKAGALLLDSIVGRAYGERVKHGEYGHQETNDINTYAYRIYGLL